MIAVHPSIIRIRKAALLPSAALATAPGGTRIETCASICDTWERSPKQPPARQRISARKGASASMPVSDTVISAIKCADAVQQNKKSRACSENHQNKKITPICQAFSMMNTLQTYIHQFTVRTFTPGSCRKQ